MGQLIKTTYLNQKDARNSGAVDNFDKLIMVTKEEDGTKKHHIIEKPMMDYYITKPEFQDNVVRNYIDKEKVRQVRCYNRDIFKSIATELKDPSVKIFYDNIMKSEDFRDRRNLKKMHLDYRIHGSDKNIEDNYIHRYLEKHAPDNNLFGLKKSFYDIEVDTQNIIGFPDQKKAEAPINIITLVNEWNLTVETFALKYDHDGYKDAMLDKTKLLDELKNKYKEYNLDLTFNIYEYDKEIDLISDFFHYINEVHRPDFASAWNADFDFITIYNRILKNNAIPEELMCPDDFKYKYVYHKMDEKHNNPADKSSIYEVAGYTTYLDQMALYANINKRATCF
ncbi:hypothetical protein FPHOBKDP_00160 [Listeria phage LPJP1]|nr:hypothetical protein FPHOBKDP_00160 [Listeria phage LPJP1]